MDHPLTVGLLFLSATVLLSSFAHGVEMPVEPYSSQPTPGEMAFVAQWKAFLLGQGEAAGERYVADLPFSFKCGERSSREWVTIAKARIESGDWQEDGSRTHVLRWKDAETLLTCEMKLREFHGYLAFDWVVEVRNGGPKDSVKVHDFWGIDTCWNATDGSMPVLHRSVGSPGHEDDFQFRSEIMHNSMWDQRRRISMDTTCNTSWGETHAYHIPKDRRSSAVWLPFFNYQTGGDGLITGLGWSGAWRAYFDHQGGGMSTILAGVKNRWPQDTYESALPDRGLAIWHIVDDTNALGVLPPPPGCTGEQWATIGADDWGRRALRMVRPVLGDDTKALWDGAEEATGYNLLPVSALEGRATLTWYDGTPSPFSILDIPEAAPVVTVTVQK